MNQLSPEKLESLLVEHGGALMLYARQWSTAPEDIVQEAFLLLIQQRLAPENAVGWLYRAVRNRAISDVRSENRRRRRETVVALYSEPWFKPTNGARLDAMSATLALEALPIEQRETVVARLWGGLSFAEIAELTETSSSTAARRYQAGLIGMRERLRIECVKTKNIQKS